jgi:hypothetical protein
MLIRRGGASWSGEVSGDQLLWSRIRGLEVGVWICGGVGCLDTLVSNEKYAFYRSEDVHLSMRLHVRYESVRRDGWG